MRYPVRAGPGNWTSVAHRRPNRTVDVPWLLNDLGRGHRRAGWTRYLQRHCHLRDGWL